jgi:hypothetical protein
MGSARAGDRQRAGAIVKKRNRRRRWTPAEEMVALDRVARQVEVRLPRIPRPSRRVRDFLARLGVEQQAQLMEAMVARDAGAGIDMPRWARGERGAAIDDRDFRWLYALNELERHGNKAQLLKLLTSDAEMSPNVRRHLADLIDRHELKRRPGRQPAPSYDLPPEHVAILRGVALVRASVAGGMSVDDACARHAAEVGVPADTLATAYGGKHGTARRLKRRGIRS